MALSTRRRQRRRNRWLFLGVLLSLAVLALNAALSARSDGPGRRLAQLAYLDEVRPEVERSTALGADVAQVRNNATTLGRDGVTRRLRRVDREARAVLSAVKGLDPPPELSTVHAELITTMALRSRAATAIARSLETALGTAPPDAAIDALARAGGEMVASDRIYEVFLDSLPRLADTPAPLMPPSQWVAEPDLWRPAEVAAFVATLRSSATLAPVHDVRVVTVRTDPAPVATDGGAAVVPMPKVLRLEIVVANTGNEAERYVPVVATLTGPGGQVDTARDFVDLAPGQRRSLRLAGLRPVAAGPSSLLVTIGPVDGEENGADNVSGLSLVLRG